jgi:hypothetical protein
MKAHIRSIYRDTPVASVWHPEAVGDLLDTVWGNVRVSRGEPQYQLATGEMKSI